MLPAVSVATIVAVTVPSERPAQVSPSNVPIARPALHNDITVAWVAVGELIRCTWRRDRRPQPSNEISSCSELSMTPSLSLIVTDSSAGESAVVSLMLSAPVPVAVLPAVSDTPRSWR